MFNSLNVTAKLDLLGSVPLQFGGKSLRRVGVDSSLNVGSNLPVHPFGPRIFFVDRFLIDSVRLSAARRESGSRCPWLGEAAPQPECCSVCAQKAPARPGLP